MNVQGNVEDKEFIALSPDTIRTLIDNRQRMVDRMSSRPRRRTPRWPFPGQVQLWCPNRFGDETQVFGTCRNLNEQGVGFYCERPFEAGARLTIAIHQPEATYQGDGVVRHCTPSDEEYFIGMEFIESHAD